MKWPISQDYNEAIQSPAVCFSDPQLRQGQPVTNAMGIPMPRSGNFADVYEFVSNGEKWAIKCFTREVPGLTERYSLISSYLKQLDLPFLVEFSVMPRGIRVRGQWFPILKMQWVEGQTLNEFVGKNIDKPQVLENLCQIWTRMASRIRESKFAHCDLQIGNVLLTSGIKTGSLAVKLVDYDGLWVPVPGLPRSSEIGHPNFQHPDRAKIGYYGIEADRFSNLLIYTALKCLAFDGPRLWQKYDNSDNLLFRQRDLENPDHSPLFQDLARLPDPNLARLAGNLARAAKIPLEQTPLVEELGSGERVALKADMQPRVASYQLPPAVRAIAAVPDLKPSTQIEQTEENLEFESFPIELRSKNRQKKRNTLYLFASIPILTFAIGIFWWMNQAWILKTLKDPNSVDKQTQTKKEPGIDPSREVLERERNRTNFKRLLEEGKIALKQGNYFQAEKQFSEAISLFPGDSEAQSGLDQAKQGLLASDQSGSPGQGSKSGPKIQPGKPFNNSLGMKFAWIPPGSFMLDSSNPSDGREIKNETQQKVTLREGFFLGAFEVTQEQWQTVMGSNPSHFKGAKNLPVENVSWTECQEFLEKLSKQDGKLYRLPTEAEWEYACRAGTATPFHFGETISTNQANYNGIFAYGKGENGLNREKTIPVGSFAPNAFGLYDMHGNVGEWCNDWYGEYPKAALFDPMGPKDGSRRVFRGGSWNSDPWFCKTAYRNGKDPNRRFDDIGLRLCINPDNNSSR